MIDRSYSLNHLRKWSREQDKQLLELWAQGLSQMAIAERLDRSHNSVAGRVKVLRSKGYEVPAREQPSRLKRSKNT